MKLKELKEWLETIPTIYDETELVFRTIEKSGEADVLYARDEPIVAVAIDEDNKETFFLNHESALILDNNETMKQYNQGDTIQIGKYLTEIREIGGEYFLYTSTAVQPTYLEDIFRQFNLSKEDIFKVYGYEAEGGFPFARSLKDLNKAIHYLLNLSQESNLYRIDKTVDGEIIKVTKLSTGEQFTKGDTVYHNEYDRLIGPIWFDEALTGKRYFPGGEIYKGHIRAHSGIYPIDKLFKVTQTEIDDLTVDFHDPRTTNLDYTTEYQNFYSDLFN